LEQWYLGLGAWVEAPSQWLSRHNECRAYSVEVVETCVPLVVETVLMLELLLEPVLVLVGAMVFRLGSVGRRAYNVEIVETCVSPLTAIVEFMLMLELLLELLLVLVRVVILVLGSVGRSCESVVESTEIAVELL
jgi:hypothetical protein